MERCCIPGTYDKTEYPKRNKEIFKQFGYNNHQSTVSPLTEIGIDNINLFPLDYMHLVCLSVVRRILNYLKKAPRRKIPANQNNEILRLLVSFNGPMPNGFCRQPRSLKDFWQFLLYSRPIALQDIISDNAYEQLLALSITLTILMQSNDQIRCQYLDYARDLI